MARVLTLTRYLKLSSLLYRVLYDALAIACWLYLID